MWFKHRGWIPVAWVLSAANLVALWFAAGPGEAFHATTHGLLAVLFGLGARRLMARQSEVATGDLRQALDENERLQHDNAQMRERLQELEERADFAERLLNQQRDSVPAKLPE